MANCCSNTIALFGYEENKVDEFRKLMVKSFRESRNVTVRDFVVTCGYTIDEASKLVDGRDIFVDVDDKTSEKEGVYYFKFQTESAWNPNVDIFNRIIRDKFKDEFEFEYCSEEPGLAIYINTDVEGFFFTDRYYLDSCINDEYETEYFESKEEVLEWIRDKFPEVKVTIKTALHKIEDEVQKYIDENSDDFFTLYKFSYE
ncbi:MAG: hypothetical protein IJV92_08565 [Phascolarctobacterium sp.]|nr:hypothetical protein [Phascolarctobacterium sp.]